MTAAAQPKNLIQKCAAVMASLQHVPKNGWNDFHKYHYATEADIADAVREAMAAEGVMLIPSVEKVEWRDVQSKSGQVEKIATLTVRYRLTDGLTAEEFTVLGEGQDRGDKATYKAMTGATKYALLKLFLISTGDDPEAEEGEKPPPAKGSAPRPAAPPSAPASRDPKTPADGWAKAQEIYGGKELAEAPWKAAVAKVTGGRPSNTMTPAEVADVLKEVRLRFEAENDIKY